MCKKPIDLGFFLQYHGLLCLKLRDLQSLSVIMSLFSLQTSEKLLGIWQLAKQTFTSILVLIQKEFSIDVALGI